MGAGDWLMATGEVKARYAVAPSPVLVVGVDGRRQWSDVFIGNGKILRRATGAYQTLVNGPGARPYIKGKTPTNWTWRAYKPTPGELFLTDEERAVAKGLAGHVLIEPHGKAIGHANKLWPFERWQALADLQIAPMVQVGPEGTRWLDGVQQVRTRTFREACAVLANARAFVGGEGGLMHAAAALGVRGVILYSEFISPAVTGYGLHRNIRHALGDGLGCGMRAPCETCRASMDAITVGEVVDNLVGVLREA